MKCRRFWLHSRINEDHPELLEASSVNKFPMIPLPAHPCDELHLRKTFNKYPIFPHNSPELDGILFYHTEGFYTRGETPLVGWLKPFMIPEVFKVEIVEPYMALMPSNYETYSLYIEEFNRMYSEKKKRGLLKGKEVGSQNGMDTSSDPEEIMSVDQIEELGPLR